MIDCEKAAELISLYIDGEISDEEKAALTEHISGCPECTDLLNIYAEVSNLMADDVEPPEALLSGVMAGVKKINEERAIPKRRARVIILKWAAVAACAALVLTAGYRMLPRLGSSNLAADCAAPEAAQNYSVAYSETATAQSTEEAYDSKMYTDSGSATADEGAVSDNTFFADSGTAESTGTAEDRTASGENGVLGISPASAEGIEPEAVKPEEVSAGKYYAVVYVSALPEEIESEVAVFPLEDGRTAAEISLDEFESLFDEEPELREYEIEYSSADTDSTVVLIVCDGVD